MKNTLEQNRIALTNLQLEEISNNQMDWFDGTIYMLPTEDISMGMKKAWRLQQIPDIIIIENAEISQIDQMILKSWDPKISFQVFSIITTLQGISGFKNILNNKNELSWIYKGSLSLYRMDDSLIYTTQEEHKNWVEAITNESNK